MKKKLIKAIEKRYGTASNPTGLECMFDAMRECQLTVYVNLADDIKEEIDDVEKAIEKIIFYHSQNYYNTIK
jgi:capsule polysaccharide export protein KpsC/LpsZ